LIDDLEAKLEKRIVELLDMATEPKDLTAAIKVAVEWVSVKRADKDGWGSALGGERNGDSRAR
jgi:hypothetical protein